jgi:Xaa-Pro aminopeptidase
MEHLKRRRAELARSLRPAGLDSLLVSDPLNVAYLSGFTGGDSFLVLTPRRAILVSDHRYAGQIEDECPDLETHLRPHNQTTHQAVANVLSGLKVRSVGVESAHLTLAEFETLQELAPALEWSPRKHLVEALRAIKDDSEIEQIREAIDMAARAFTMLRAMLSPKDTEKELADALDGYVRRAGGRGSPFSPIIAAGERSALPHCPPTDRVVSESNFLLVDWGAQGRLYQSDLTRVLRMPARPAKAVRARGGRVETRLQKVYTIVLQAQARAIAAVRPGADAKDVDAAARSFIAAAGYGPHFTHGLGHGIGLQTHEAPRVRENSTDVLRAGMVITIEPGIYLPGWGGVRIEDDVLVTEDGCEVLSAAVPKEWEDVTMND